MVTCYDSGSSVNQVGVGVIKIRSCWGFKEDEDRGILVA